MSNIHIARGRARIENWCFTSHGDQYTPPEMMVPVLRGNVVNHYRIGSREDQTTSRLLGRTEDGMLVTKNTVYELGEIDPGYEKAFPGAKDRLISQLPVLEVVLPKE